MIPVNDVDTVMRFFRSHRVASQLERLGDQRELSRVETSTYIDAVEKREMLRAKVRQINERSFSAAAAINKKG